MQTDKTRVIILTPTFKIKGIIDLLPGSRLTNFMNESKTFIALTDATVSALDGSSSFSAPFLNFRLCNVEVIFPDPDTEEQK